MKILYELVVRVFMSLEKLSTGNIYYDYVTLITYHMICQLKIIQETRPFSALGGGVWERDYPNGD